MINVRQKGAEGEREVARALNSIINTVLAAKGIPLPPEDIVQRNQNQSAVGGSDLSNTFGLSIEVKRQEQLAINTWWAQCEASAKRNNELPVLIFRQNSKGGPKRWRVIMYANLEIFAPQGYNTSTVKARCEVEWESFLQWFYHWVNAKILHGEMPRT